MKASVYHRRGELEVEDRPVPELGEHDVLLEVDFCGVCGSDIHFVLEGWGQPGSVEGHEFSGRVAAIGAKVDKWKIGEEAVGGPLPRCGECNFCQAGRPSLCAGRRTPGVAVNNDGAFAQFVRVNQEHLLKIPAGLSVKGAALAEPLAVALHGINRSGVQAGQRSSQHCCGQNQGSRRDCFKRAPPQTARAGRVIGSHRDGSRRNGGSFVPY